MKYGGNWKATIPSLPASRSGAIALQNIWNAISRTSFDGRVSWRLVRSSAGNISRNCFGSRDISAGCCIISANGLMLKRKPAGVRSAHSFAFRSAGRA
jgi:hypothetical protein